MPDLKQPLADDVASASAEFCMQSWLPNFLPAERHAALRELIQDLVVGALAAYAEEDLWRAPEPSDN